MANNRPWGLITSPRGGPGGPGTGFCSPGGGLFSLSRRSGLPLSLLPFKPPQDYKNQYQDHQDHPGTRY